MKKILLFIFIFSIAAFAQQLTLRECIETGLANSKQLKISQSKIKYSNAMVEEINSMFLPQIKLSAGYFRLSNIPPFEVQVPFSPLPIKISDAILNSYTLRLSVQQPLFTGFKLLSSKRSLQKAVESNQHEYNKEINESAFTIYTAFWNYYNALENKKLLDENVNQMNFHLEKTEHFFVNGLASESDVMKMKVYKSNIELMQIEAEHNVHLTAAALNKAMEIKLNSEIEIVADNNEIISDAGTLSDYINEALKNRAELKSLKSKNEYAEESISAARSGWYPHIYASGNFTYSNPNVRIMPAQNKFYDTWDAGITLSWDLNLLQTSSKVEQAEEMKYQTVLVTEQIIEAIELEVTQSYLQLHKAIETINAGKINLAYAEENNRITEQKFIQNIASSGDVIDAENSLLQAKTKFITSIAYYKIARVQFLKSLGRKIY